MTDDSQHINKIHEIMNTISQEWSQREWGGVEWNYTQWYNAISQALPLIAQYCQPWTMSSQLSCWQDVPLECATFVQNIAKNTLRWLCILQYYQASEEGLFHKFLDDLKRSPAIEKSWSHCLRRSLNQNLIDHVYSYAQHLSQEAQLCVHPVLFLWLQAPVLLHQEADVTLQQKKVIFNTLHETYQALLLDNRFPTKPRVLQVSAYANIWDACTYALQANWAESHLALSQCTSLDDRIVAHYYKALESLKSAIKHGIGHLEKTSSISLKPLPMHETESIDNSQEPKALLAIPFTQTPLPQSGSVVGHYEWRLEGRLSKLTTCRTWKARRRQGSIYKKAAVKWSKLASNLENKSATQAPVWEAQRALTLVALDETLYESFMHRGKAWQTHGITRFVKVLEYGWDPVRERLCIVEDLLDGPSLYEAHRSKPLSMKQLLSLAKDLMISLMYLHHQNLYHGNIKPENVVWHQGSWYWTDAHLLVDHPIGGGQESRKRSSFFQAPDTTLGALSDLYAFGKMIEELQASVKDSSDEEQAFIDHIIIKLTQSDSTQRGTADLYIDGWGDAPKSMVLRTQNYLEEVHLYPHQVYQWLLQVLPSYTLKDLSHTYSISQASTGLNRSPNIALDHRTTTNHLSHLSDEVWKQSVVEVRAQKQWKNVFYEEQVCRGLYQKNKRQALPITALLDRYRKNEVHPQVIALSHWYLPAADNNSENSIHFVLIPAGISALGEEYYSETPFFMSITPITLAVWQSYMGSKVGVSTHKDTPVESVHFIEAQNFCYALQAHINQYNTTEMNLHVRLPTVTEWTYAALAGQIGEYAGDMTPYDGVCSLEKSQGQLSPVAQFKPNAWGLFDMSGLVWEWVLSYAHQPKYHQKEELVFKKHADKERMICGGIWIDSAMMCSALQYKKRLQSSRSFDQGFRVILHFSKS